jgi:hypothetical protein
MKKIIILSVVLCSMIFALEPTSLNLQVPSGLEKNELYMDVVHRHKGLIRINKGSVGIGEGANVGLNLRYRAWQNLDINAVYIRDNKEYAIGASYAYFIPQAMLRSQIGFQYFTYEKQPLARRRNFFYSLVLQTDPLLNKFIPTVNLAYDGYNQKVGLGIGANVEFRINLGPLDKLNLIGEYFPVLSGLDEEEESDITGPTNSFAFGINFSSYRHQFIFLAGNNTDISSRRQMLGAVNNDFHFGFIVTRFQSF